MNRIYTLTLLCIGLIFGATCYHLNLQRVFAKGYRCHSAKVPDPTTASDFMTASRAYYNDEEMDCSLSAAEEAVLLAPDNARALSMRGFAHFGLHETSAAKADFNRAVQLDATFPEAFDGRSQVYESLGDLDNAIADLTACMKLAENNREFYYLFVSDIAERGNLYLKKGAAHAALADFSEAVRREPNFHIWYRDRARAYRRLGQTEAALRDEAKADELKSVAARFLTQKLPVK